MDARMAALDAVAEAARKVSSMLDEPEWGLVTFRLAYSTAREKLSASLAALAAVAPMIAAGEREACVAICEDVFSGSAGITLHPALRIADAIRARATSQASEPPPPSE